MPLQTMSYCTALSASRVSLSFGSSARNLSGSRFGIENGLCEKSPFFSSSFHSYIGKSTIQQNSNLSFAMNEWNEEEKRIDFPMYEWNEEEKRIDFSHNPFSMPNIEPEKFLSLDPNDRDTLLSLKAVQYDIVCNGIELSS